MGKRRSKKGNAGTGPGGAWAGSAGRPMAAQGGKTAVPASDRIHASNELIRAGKIRDAVRILQGVITEFPEHRVALERLALCLQELDAPAMAVPYWARLCKRWPEDAQLLHNFARCLGVLGRDVDAERMYKHALSVDPAHIRSLSALFHLAERARRLPEAEELVARMTLVAPDEPVTHMARARLLELQGDHASALAVMESAPLAQELSATRRQYDYHLGKLLDRAGRCAEAFAAFSAANSSHLHKNLHRAAQKDAYIRDLQAYPGHFDAQQCTGWAESLPPVPVNIVWQVGFPRSGTTLLDQVLDAHPNVTVLEEQPTTDPVVALLDQLPGGYPASLTRIDDATALELRDVYLQQLEQHVGLLSSDRVYVDKLPIRTVHLGLLARLLPGVKVIMSLRHPADVCLSCFMQSFKLNQAMSCFLAMDDTVATYNAVMDAYRHYRAVLSLDVLEVRYEQLVEDLETQARRVFEFLGQPWHPGVLEFHEHARKRQIRTTSYDQVVRPLYSDALERWKRYSEQLGPWLPALRRHAEYFGYNMSQEPTMSLESAAGTA